MSNENQESVIGADVEIIGTIKSNGSVRLDGKLEGELLCGGIAVLGKSAQIKGNVTAQIVLEGDGDRSVLAIRAGNQPEQGMCIARSRIRLQRLLGLGPCLVELPGRIQRACRRKQLVRGLLHGLARFSTDIVGGGNLGELTSRRGWTHDGQPFELSARRS